jgi:hypothetical protein
MSTSSKQAAQDFVKYLKLLPAGVLDDNNKRALLQAEKEAQAFSADFRAGKCTACGSDLSSFEKGKPCLHWLLRPVGFEKEDFPRVTDRFSMEQVERFIRRVANQEVLAKNINDMANEGTGKLVELTAKYKNLEWAISCGQGDYDGHESNSEGPSSPTITSKCGSIGTGISITVISTSRSTIRTS